MSTATHMKLTLALAIFLLATAAPSGADARKSTEAESAARAWLALVAAGNYPESWSTASKLFRGSIDKSRWAASVEHARAPLGALQTRHLQSATFARTLPGAPDGEYWVLQFSSSFQNRAEATETVTPMKDEDGRWHVSGYYIR